VPLVPWDLTAALYLFVASLPAMYSLIAFRATSLQLTSRCFSIFLAVSSSSLMVKFFVMFSYLTHSSVHTHLKAFLRRKRRSNLVAVSSVPKKVLACAELALIRFKEQEKKEQDMKDVELKLIAELMKNSRRSDRELARTIGVSQPTVSRMIQRLNKGGYVREYTIIPDFVKLGFKIMSLTFAKLTGPTSLQVLEETRKDFRKMLDEAPSAYILGLAGEGLDAERTIVAFHRSYSDYTIFMKGIKRHPLVKVEELRSFMVDLTDKTQFQPLTFSALANFIAEMAKRKE
jgi:DNA-binding Lrp family transcriptional regulator